MSARVENNLLLTFPVDNSGLYATHLLFLKFFLLYSAVKLEFCIEKSKS
jgi:hypothetical protein